LHLLQGEFRFFGFGKGGNKKGSRGTQESPWSLGYWHLLKTPSHNFLQKARGYVDGFTKIRGNNNQLKNTLFCPEVKGGIAFGKLPLETASVFKPKLIN
jgi:hypothetical protein